jgi:hypothetical protein
MKIENYRREHLLYFVRLFVNYNLYPSENLSDNRLRMTRIETCGTYGGCWKLKKVKS